MRRRSDLVHGSKVKSARLELHLESHQERHFSNQGQAERNRRLNRAIGWLGQKSRRA